MELDKIKKIETSVEKLGNKTARIYFLVQDTKGNPKAGIAYIYQMAMSLINKGFNVKMIHETSEYQGVSEWLGKEYMEIEHLPIEGQNLPISPEDFVVIPELYGHVMEQLKNYPCGKLVLCQAYDYMLETLPPGVSWANYGFLKCITTSEFQKEYIRSVFKSVSVDVVEQIGLRATPATWPVGQPGDFRGTIDRRTGLFTKYTRTARGAAAAPEEIIDADRAAAEEGDAWKVALDSCSLLDAIEANVDLPSFLAGKSTPVFVGSALTNFGVRALLDAVAELAPPPLPRVDIAEVERPLVSPFAGFVFKIQANMDPNHRDRLAFARVCSGHFERGMDIECTRSGRAVGTKYVTTAFGNDRETIEEAFPGDIIGLVNAGDLRIGDTIYAGKKVEFPGVPRFAPEVFASARPLDRSKIKQFRKGIEQLDQEGVVQVLRDLDFGDTEPVLAAVGVLQFEVFAYRLSSEFSAPTEIISSPYQAMRITDKASADRLRQIGGIRILYRSDNEMVALFENKYRLQRLEKDEPELTLKLVFDGQPDS